jgi:topoisomerase-4 subunit A
VPNVLLNGGQGIAVGMATDIPPHNLREVVSGDDPPAREAPQRRWTTCCEHVQGPDYPTAAEIITPRDDLRAMYETGHGSVRQRAVFEKEGDEVIITALPHQVSPAKVLEQIAAQMQAKKLPMVDGHPRRVGPRTPDAPGDHAALEPGRSRRPDGPPVRDHGPGKTYRVNLNVIGNDGKPGVRNLKDLLAEWIDYRRETVTRRLEHRSTRSSTACTCSKAS